MALLLALVISLITIVTMYIFAAKIWCHKSLFFNNIGATVPRGEPPEPAATTVRTRCAAILSRFAGAENDPYAEGG